MKKSTVRVFAIVLAALMCLSLLPLAAHAEEFALPEDVQQIPGFTWVGDHYEETEHIYGIPDGPVSDDYLVNPDEPGDCVTPAVYWKSCVNVNPYTGERCGHSAAGAHAAAISNMLTEMGNRLSAGEKKEDLDQIATAAAADIDARYRFTMGGQGHQWELHEHQEATCTNEGWDTYNICTVCGAVDVGEIPWIDAKGHQWGEPEVVTAATCSEPGLVKYVCTICGVEETEEVPATGEHVWDDGVVALEPTCAAAGQKVYTCIVCNATETEEIPATGEHNFVDGFCTVCGAEDPDYVAPVVVEDTAAFENPAPAVEQQGGDNDTTEGGDNNTTEGGDNNTTEGGDNDTTEGGDNDTTEGDNDTTEGGDNNTTEGGDNNTTEGGDNDTTEGDNDTTEGGDNDTTEGGDNDTTEGGDNDTTEGGDNDTTEGGDNNTTEGGDNNTTEGSDNNTTEGGDNDTTEGGDNDTTEGGDNSTTEGGDNDTAEGGDNNTTEGGDNNTTEGGDNNTTEGDDNDTTEGGDNAKPYDGEVIIKQEDASKEVVDSFKAAMAEKGYNADNSGFEVKDVTPYREDGKTELSDEEIAAMGGVTFVMDLPEDYDPASGEPEIYHYNEETKTWELMDSFVKDGKVYVRKASAFSPFGLRTKRLDHATTGIVFPKSSTSQTAAFNAAPVTITLDLDGGTLDSGYTNPATTDANGKLTLPSRTQCTKTDYSLVGWTTEGGNFLPGKEYTFTSPMTLKAKWAKNVKIIFDPNAVGAEGFMPSQDKDADGYPLYAGQYVEINANQYTNGDETFKNWSTTATGGTSYADKAEVKLPDTDLTLYAQWTHTHVVTFKPGDGGTGTEATQPYAEGTTAKLKTLEELGFTNSAAEFLNWKDQDGTTYTDAQSIKPTKDLTLTAQWDKKYTVNFLDTTTGKTGTPQTIKQSEFDKNADGVALAANTFTRDGYAFANWDTLSAGGGKAYKDKALVKASDFDSNAKLDLYAQWAEAVTITYSGNGGTCSLPLQKVPKGKDVAIKPISTTTTDTSGKETTTTYVSRSGYFFTEWATNADGSGDKYPNGGIIPGSKVTGNITLYAQWNGPLTSTGSTTGTDSNAVIGEKLTASLPKADSSVSYEWWRLDTSSGTTGSKKLVANGTTYTITPEDAGKFIVCQAKKDGQAIRSNVKEVDKIELLRDIVNDANSSSYGVYAQSGAINGLSDGMKYTLLRANGSVETGTVSGVKDGIWYTNKEGDYIFTTADGSAVGDIITVYDWYTVGYQVTTSSGTTGTSSGVRMLLDGGAMPTYLFTNATYRDRYDVLRYTNSAYSPSTSSYSTSYSSAYTLYAVKKGSNPTITLTVTPPAGTYAHVSLNGSSIASWGSGTTTTATGTTRTTTTYSRTFTVTPPNNGPKFYTIIFNNSATSPRTADESNLGLWSALCLTSVVGGITILTETRKRRKNRG